MSGRPYDDNPYGPRKRQKQDHYNSAPRQYGGNPPQISRSSSNSGPNASPLKTRDSSLSYPDAFNQLPPAKNELHPISHYIPFTVRPGLPPLPQIQGETLSTAPFAHKSSTLQYDRSSGAKDMSYERLEFLGDAQLELLASRLIFARFNHLPAGQQSQLRELLVKNETLAEYALAYGFDKKIKMTDQERMIEDNKFKGNKGWQKILGDVFEAYVAAAVLSDPEHGWAVVEKWMTALWAPKLVEAAKHNLNYAAAMSVQTASGADPAKVYNPAAKAELQKRIAGAGVKLEYERYKDTLELKGDALGQSRSFMAVYYTGGSHVKKMLGKGEGKNKVEAGNWAAMEAMHGECKGFVVECEVALAKTREERKRKDEEARLAAEGDGSVVAEAEE